MEMDRAETGKIGEKLALEYLLQRGYVLLEKNWRDGRREIDLIMQGEDGLHVVEVRTRHVPYSISPEESVGCAKRRRIVAAAGAYVRKARMDADVRFDVVSVVFGLDGKYTIEYIPDAFIPFK